VSVALMAIAIESLGVPAISFTAAQIGILTDSLHTRARIREISTERVFQALGEGKIVIVAGFQGVDRNAEITTLGRGGSDTTAVALAAVLGADACEVYTDVNGVSTADPRKAGQVRYWQYGLAGNSPNLAKSDPSRFPLSRSGCRVVTVGPCKGGVVGHPGPGGRRLAFRRKVFGTQA